MQKLARILHYFDDVRDAYIACTRRGDVLDAAWFCPELEYHMWLDFIQRAYHEDARACMKNDIGVTFEYVLRRQQPDILSRSKLSSRTFA